MKISNKKILFLIFFCLMTTIKLHGGEEIYDSFKRFIENEIKLQIKNMKKSKALGMFCNDIPGFDKITVEFVDSLPGNAIATASQKFSKTIESTHVANAYFDDWTYPDNYCVIKITDFYARGPIVVTLHEPSQCPNGICSHIIGKSFTREDFNILYNANLIDKKTSISDIIGKLPNNDPLVERLSFTRNILIHELCHPLTYFYRELKGSIRDNDRTNIEGVTILLAGLYQIENRHFNNFSQYLEKESLPYREHYRRFIEKLKKTGWKENEVPSSYQLSSIDREKWNTEEYLIGRTLFFIAAYHSSNNNIEREAIRCYLKNYFIYYENPKERNKAVDSFLTKTKTYKKLLKNNYISPVFYSVSGETKEKAYMPNDKIHFVLYNDKGVVAFSCFKFQNVQDRSLTLKRIIPTEKKASQAGILEEPIISEQTLLYIPRGTNKDTQSFYFENFEKQEQECVKKSNIETEKLYNQD